jgi:hypothetical protein
MINNESIEAVEQTAPPSVAVAPQHLAVPDGWISVKDALPEIDNSGHIQNTRVTVLAVRDYEGPVSQMSYVVIPGSQPYWTYADGRSSRFGPTHWMYMPVFPAAPAAQGDAKDTCAEMRALCSACGGTGDVHGLDGEWRGQCTCVHVWQQRAEKAEADLKQVNEWRAAALTESQTLGELWASKVEQAEARVKELQAELDIELERAYDCLLAARTNKQADRQALQAEGKHPAPCARDCEAPAFKNQVRERDARIAQLEARLVRRRAPLSPEAQQAIAAARAAGQTIAATPGGLAFLNSGTEPGRGELDCPACGGSGHAGDVPAGSTP